MNKKGTSMFMILLLIVLIFGFFYFQSNDLYFTEEQALSKTSDFGCSGFHKHSIMYMPCDSHSEYTDARGLG